MKKRILPALLALAIVFTAFGASSALARSDGKTVEIWLSRHGQTLANLNDRCNGWSDSPLTAAGQASSHYVGTGLREKGIIFDAVYSSSIGRCVQTAEILMQELGLDLPIHQDRRLREMNMGDYELKSFSGFLKDFPNTYNFDEFPGVPGGESWDSLWARVEPALLEIGSVHASTQGGKVLVTTHGYVMLTTMINLDSTYEFKGSASLPNNCIIVLVYKDGKLTVKTQPTAEYSEIGMKALGVTPPPARGH